MVRHAGLHRPLVVIDRAVAIDQVAHVVQGSEAPVDAAEVAEKAGVDRSAAEVELQPAPFRLKAAGRCIHDRETGAPSAPGGIQVLLFCVEAGGVAVGGIEGVPERAEFELRQVAEALMDGAAPAQAAGQLQGAAAAGFAATTLSGLGQ